MQEEDLLLVEEDLIVVVQEEDLLLVQEEYLLAVQEEDPLVLQEESLLVAQEEDLLVEQREKQGRNWKSPRCMNRVATAPFELKPGQNDSDGLHLAF